MTLQLPSSKQLDKSKQANPWDFGNKVLYDLCRDNFSHRQDEKILAKVWLIGRAYSVAIERRRNKSDINDNFYIDKVAPTFRKSNLDDHIHKLKQIKKLTVDNIQQVLESHMYLTTIVSKITDLEKRSFSSKYLHFHLPELFFIYDTRAVTAMRNFISRVPKQFDDMTKTRNVDNEYAKFFCKCFDLKTRIEKHFGTTITNRQLDNILIEIANNNKASVNFQR